MTSRIGEYYLLIGWESPHQRSIPIIVKEHLKPNENIPPLVDFIRWKIRPDQVIRW